LLVGQLASSPFFFSYRDADIMSGRVSKSVKSRPKISEECRQGVASLVAKFGFEMPRCSACFKANQPSCVVAEGKQRCDFCISKKYHGCDFGGVSAQACTHPSFSSGDFSNCFVQMLV